jgi:hypothetical protein
VADNCGIQSLTPMFVLGRADDGRHRKARNRQHSLRKGKLLASAETVRTTVPGTVEHLAMNMNVHILDRDMSASVQGCPVHSLPRHTD